jgi:hypothetical protein
VQRTKPIPSANFGVKGKDFILVNDQYDLYTFHFFYHFPPTSFRSLFPLSSLSLPLHLSVSSFCNLRRFFIIFLLIIKPTMDCILSYYVGSSNTAQTFITTFQLAITKFCCRKILVLRFSKVSNTERKKQFISLHVCVTRSHNF